MTFDDPLFRDVPDHLYDQAGRRLRTLDADKGDVLLEEGEINRSVVYVLEGRVGIERGGKLIDTSGPGQVLGEMALFRGTPRVGRVIAREPTRVLRLDLDGYDALRLANNPVAFNLERLALEQLGQRLRRLDALVAERAVGGPNPFAPPKPGFFERLRKLVLGEKAPPELEPHDFDPAEALSESHLLRGEPWVIVKALAERFEPCAFRQGELLCKKGEPGDALYMMVDGWADVLVEIELPGQAAQVHKMGAVGRGAAVGMTSLLDGRPRSANVVATTQVDALALEREKFDALVGENGQVSSAFRRVMIRAFAEQVDEAGARLVELAGDATSFVEATASLEVYAP